MRHHYSGRKLSRTASHRRALLCNLASSLITHKRITTTEAKAKELRPFVERLITKAKNAAIREAAGQLPEGHTVDIHQRREVFKYLRSEAVIEELFSSVAPVVEKRQGGYTRVVKLGQRRGDGARTALIELVDFAESQDGSRTLGRSKSKRKPASKAATAQALQQQVAATLAQVEEAVQTAETEGDDAQKS